jgi:hypothetical protein
MYRSNDVPARAPNLLPFFVCPAEDYANPGIIWPLPAIKLAADQSFFYILKAKEIAAPAHFTG